MSIGWFMFCFQASISRVSLLYDMLPPFLDYSLACVVLTTPATRCTRSFLRGRPCQSHCRRSASLEPKLPGPVRVSLCSKEGVFSDMLTSKIIGIAIFLRRFDDGGLGHVGLFLPVDTLVVGIGKWYLTTPSRLQS
jgi:hypothetical protein